MARCQAINVAVVRDVLITVSRHNYSVNVAIVVMVVSLRHKRYCLQNTSV